MAEPEDHPVELGWIGQAVAEEFPELRMYSVTFEGRSYKRSPPELHARLRSLSDSVRGSTVMMLRQQPIPYAYRVFFRHIGLDPDRTLPPQEALALERLREGRFAPRNTLDDALRVALMETGVPLWAFDADTVSGPLGLRTAVEGESLGRVAPIDVPPGRLVVADAEGPLAILFGLMADGHGVTFATRRMTLFTVQVKGVPSIHVEEALWEAMQWLV